MRHVFNEMIENESRNLINDFVDDELRNIAERQATMHHMKCEAQRLNLGPRCKLFNAISDSEYVVDLHRKVTTYKLLYQLAREALGLKPNASSTSVLLMLQGVEVSSNDCNCFKRISGHHIQYVLHK